MYKVVLLFTILGLQTCIIHSLSSHVGVVDDEFKPFVKVFNEVAKLEHSDVNANSIDISFENIPKNKEGQTTLAYCNYNKQKISVNIDTWYKSTNIRQELIVLHELGHCALNRLHSTKVKEVEMYVGKVPATIMMPIGLPQDDLYMNYRKQYWHELFNPGEF